VEDSCVRRSNSGRKEFRRESIGLAFADLYLMREVAEWREMDSQLVAYCCTKKPTRIDEMSLLYDRIYAKLATVVLMMR
jgi:hypothetical protein